jgi:chromosome segregation ATPase
MLEQELHKIDPMGSNTRDSDDDLPKFRVELERGQQFEDDSHELRSEITHLREENKQLSSQVLLLRSELAKEQNQIKLHKGMLEQALQDLRENNQDKSKSKLAEQGQDEKKEQMMQIAKVADGFKGGLEEMMWCKERSEMLTDELEAAVRTIGDQGVQIRLLIDKLDQLGMHEFTKGFTTPVKRDELGKVSQVSRAHASGTDPSATSLAQAVQDVDKLSKERIQLQEQVQSLSAQRTQLSAAASVFAEHADALTRDLRIKTNNEKRYKMQHEHAVETIRNICDNIVVDMLEQVEHIHATLEMSARLQHGMALEV